jgi:long-chain acyl-CoA synthetase
MRLPAFGLLLLLVALAVPAAAGAAEVEGVKLDDRIFVAQGLPELQLNGAGPRRKLLVAKVYVAALYLTHRRTTSDAVLADPGPTRLAMHVLHDEILAEDLIAMLNDGLSANNQLPELGPLESRIRDLAAMMRQVGRITQGGVVLLDYLPGIGTRITINGVARATIPGADFNRALMRIWLGDRPVDGRLKRMLLGAGDSLLPF